MILRFIGFYLASLLSFFLFYFNAAYWTGKGMAELSSNGIWRALYRLLSKIGTLVYRLCESVFRLIPLPHNGTLSVFFNLIFYIGVLFCITHGYADIMDNIFPAGIGELVDGNGTTLWGHITSAVMFLRVIGQANSILGVVSAWAIYTVFNTLLFSILFGFLQNKVRELNLSNGAQPDAGQLTNNIHSFLEQFTVVLNMDTRGVLPLFLVALFLYSIYQTIVGGATLTLLDVFVRVLEEIELVPIVISFILTYGACKVTCVAASKVTEHLPTAVQGVLNRVSEKGNAWVEQEDARRKEWATKHATTPPKTKEESWSKAPVTPTPASTTLRKMELQQSRDVYHDTAAATEYINRKLAKYATTLADGKDKDLLAGVDVHAPNAANLFLENYNRKYHSEADMCRFTAIIPFMLPAARGDEIDVEYDGIPYSAAKDSQL